jgi:hypothetical protein
MWLKPPLRRCSIPKPGPNEFLRTDCPKQHHTVKDFLSLPGEEKLARSAGGSTWFY